MHDESDNECQHTFDIEDRVVRIRNFTTLKNGDLIIEQAAETMNLDVSEIEWALEEFGRCDTDEFVCWQPSKANGIDFPTAQAPQK